VTLDVPVLGLRYYHDLHFFCSQCGDPFMDPKSLRKITSQVNEDAPQPLAKPFVVHDGWPYCETCMVNLHSPRCQACKKPIVDEVIKADGKQYHPECFVCVVRPQSCT
jgi:paxillin